MKKARLGILLSSLLASAVIMAACSNQSGPAGPVVVTFDGLETEVRDSESFVGTFAECLGGEEVSVRVVAGTTVDGDDFLVVRPLDDWSGDLVVFAHGYRDPTDPVYAEGFWSDPPTSLAGLLASLGGLDSVDLTGGVGPALALAVCPVSGLLGLEDKAPAAFAASSYSSNGYAVDVAVPQTHVVNGLFDAYLGEPSRRFITGASLGGIISLEIAETYGEAYAGALPTCGPIGGSLAQLEYVGHVEYMFRYLFPEVFDDDDPASIDLTVPLGLPYGDPALPGDGNTVVDKIVAAVTSDGTGRLDRLAAIEVDPLGGTRRPLLQYDPDDPDSRLRSVLDAFFYTAAGKQDVLDLTGGGLPFDNQEATYYDGAGDSVILTAPAPRFAADQDAVAYFLTHYEPSGNLTLPTITVHNRYDPVVPSFHEEVYADLVAGQGQSDNLVTAIVPIDSPWITTSTEAFGHCGFAEEVVVAYAALGQWASTGERPAILGLLEP